MKREFLKLLNINNMKELEAYKISFYDIKETMNTSEIHRDVTNGFAEVLDNIEKKYGKIAKFIFWYQLLTDYEYDDNSTYKTLFESNYIMTEECQDTEYYDLDLLVKFGGEMCQFLSGFGLGEHGIKKLTTHFKNVKIKLDKRGLITYRDEEHMKLSEKLLVFLDQQNDDIPKIAKQEWSLDKLIFLNPNEHEILNIEEVVESSDELRDILDSLDILTLLEDAFITLAEKELNLDEVELYLCMDAPKQKDPSIFYFSDMEGHPKSVTDEFKKALSRFKADEYSKMVVETYSDHVYNVIRHGVVKGEVKLKDDVFHYEDNDGVIHTMSIKSNGKTEPEFPSGFFDITLDLLYDINRNQNG